MPFDPPLFAPVQRVRLHIESKRDAPASLTVPRGTIVEIDGPVVGNDKKRFWAIAAGKSRAETVAGNKWKLEVPTHEIEASETELSLHCAIGRGPADEFLRIRLRVLQTNPFRTVGAFRKQDGSLTWRVEGAPPDLALRYEFLEGGQMLRALSSEVALPLRAQDALPGIHTCDATVEIPYGIRIPVPRASFDVPYMVDLSRTDEPGTQITVTETNHAESLSGRAAPIEGGPAVPHRLLLDGQEKGEISPDGTFRVSRRDLARGPHRLVAEYRTEEGVIVPSRPFSFECRWDETYLELRTRDRLAELVSRHCPTLLRAFRLTWGVRTPDEIDALVVYRDGAVHRKGKADDRREPVFLMENWRLFAEVLAEHGESDAPKPEGALSAARLIRLASVAERYEDVVVLLRTASNAMDGGTPPPDILAEPTATYAFVKGRESVCRDLPARLLGGTAAVAKLAKALVGFSDVSIPTLDGQFERVARRAKPILLRRAAFYEWQGTLTKILRPYGLAAPNAFPIVSARSFFDMVELTPLSSIRSVQNALQARRGLVKAGGEGDASRELPQAYARLVNAFALADPAKVELIAATALYARYKSLFDKRDNIRAALAAGLVRNESVARKEIRRLNEILGPVEAQIDAHRMTAMRHSIDAYEEIVNARAHFVEARDSCFPNPAIQGVRM